MCNTSIVFNNCIMGMSDLPDMCTHILGSLAWVSTYQGKSRVHVVQLICTMYRLITYVCIKANSLLKLALKPIKSNSLDLLYRQFCKVRLWKAAL